MKITIGVTILVRESVSSWLQKVIDRCSRPHLGELIPSAPWKEPRRVIAINAMGQSEPSLFDMESHRVATVEEADRLVEQYESHGWKNMTGR